MSYEMTVIERQEAVDQLTARIRQAVDEWDQVDLAELHADVARMPAEALEPHDDVYQTNLKVDLLMARSAILHTESRTADTATLDALWRLLTEHLYKLNCRPVSA